MAMTLDILQRARRLRVEATDAETILWGELRNRRLNGHKFVRQLPIGPFVADFACRPARLVVELDGGQHGTADALGHDAGRSRFLNANGFGVLRFWNEEVLRYQGQVLDTILAVLNGEVAGPSPGLRFAPATLSPEGRGGARPRSRTF